MNPLGVLGKLAQKPSNAKIRIARFVFAVLLILVIVFGWNATNVNISIFDHQFYDLPDEAKFALFVFPFIGLVRAIIDPGLFRKAIWKRVIISCGVLMMIFSVFFLSETQPINMASTLSPNVEITPETLKQIQQKAEDDAMFSVVSTDTWIAFFGFITLFVGLFLNNKNLTTKNEKFGEKITVIRA